MKECSWCGLVYSDDNSVCAVDHRPLVEKSLPPTVQRDFRGFLMVAFRFVASLRGFALFGLLAAVAFSCLSIFGLKDSGGISFGIGGGYVLPLGNPAWLDLTIDPREYGGIYFDFHLDGLLIDLGIAVIIAAVLYFILSIFKRVSKKGEPEHSPDG